MAEKGVSRASPAPAPFWYRAQPSPRSRHRLGVIDGDTLDLTLDLGFRLTLELRVRLLDVDTPEIRKDTGEGKLFKELSMAWVSEAIEFGGDWPLLVCTSKADSFGRWLATVVNHKNICLSSYLILCGAPQYFAKMSNCQD